MGCTMIVRIEARLGLTWVLAEAVNRFCLTLAQDACSLDPLQSLCRFMAPSRADQGFVLVV